MSRKTVVVALSVVVVLAGVAPLVRSWSKGVPLASGAMKSLDIEWQATRDGEKSGRTTTSDVPKIEALAALLREGEEAEDHKCVDSASLTFHRVDGTSTRIGFLAGHDCEHDEFRAYGDDGGYRVFRVARARFRGAMAALGVEDLDPGHDAQGNPCQG